MTCHDPHAPSAERFTRDTNGHEMTVLHDDGLYRHLRFKAPSLDPGGYSEYWYELITVPNTLIFRGDGDSFVFSRAEDMFKFFRSGIWPDGHHHINPGYWEEKLTSHREAARTYSLDLYNQCTAEILTEAETDYPGITTAWNEHANGPMSDYNTEYEDSARAALDDFEYQPEGATGEPFRFEDCWENGFRDHDWWYLWACHAILAGIAQYDAGKTTEEQR